MRFGAGVPRVPKRKLAVYSVGFVGLVAGVVGQSTQVVARVPGIEFVAPALVAVVLLLVVDRRPAFILAPGLALPVLPLGVSGTTLTYGAILVWASACALSWGSAPRPARLGATGIALLGVVPIFLSMVVTGYDAISGPSIRLAIAYDTAFGAAVCLAGVGVRTLVVSVAALGTYAAYAAITTPELRVIRATAVLGTNANGLGFICALGVVAGAVIIRGLRSIPRLAGVAVVGFCSIGVFDTGSRGALLAVAAGVATILFTRLLSGPWRRALVLGIALGTLMIVLAYPLMNAFLSATGRQQVGAALNVSERRETLAFAIHEGLTHPLTGIGLGNLPGVSFADPNSGLGLSAHDAFAGVFAESGLISLVLLAAIAMAAVMQSRRPVEGPLLPLVIAVIVAGISLQWWGETTVGPVALAILAAGIGHRRTPCRRPLRDEDRSALALERAGPVGPE